MPFEFVHVYVYILVIELYAPVNDWKTKYEHI